MPKMPMGSEDHGTARTHHLLGLETIWSELPPQDTCLQTHSLQCHNTRVLWHMWAAAEQVTIKQLCSTEVHRVTFFWATLSPTFIGLLLWCSVVYTTALLLDWAKSYNLVSFFKQYYSNCSTKTPHLLWAISYMVKKKKSLNHRYCIQNVL